MPKLSSLTCSASNSTDRLSVTTEVNVTKDGMFTTTLNESDVKRIKEDFGLKMDSNRQGREGFFSCNTLDGLRNEIQKFLNECISRTVVEKKEVIKYQIITNCHYTQGDKEDDYRIYPNGAWLPKRLQGTHDNPCYRWEDGTKGITLRNEPFCLSLYVKVYDKTIYRYASGRMMTEYEPCWTSQNATSNVDYLKDTVRMGFEDDSFMSSELRKKRIADLPEVDATEENAYVFVEILQFICKANGLLKQLAQPENIQSFIDERKIASLLGEQEERT